MKMMMVGLGELCGCNLGCRDMYGDSDKLFVSRMRSEECDYFIASFVSFRFLLGGKDNEIFTVTFMWE